ncbi:unnamed protein product [Psylliodes chrysocephalus]|uniref:Uncharacterized protein n=1 Tax=Psylliodes chrysocephalus TaxID=3402493 RepID=A0A9P0CUN9_9CUCU|nr:unnamed protein product [Psylliodes chrysocephala]
MLVIVFLVMLHKTVGHVVGNVETYPHLNSPTHSCKVYEDEIDFLRSKVTFCERARQNSINDCFKSQRKMEADLESSDSVCLKQHTTILKQKDLLTEKITSLAFENVQKTNEINEFTQAYEATEDEISRLNKLLKDSQHRLRKCRIAKKKLEVEIKQLKSMIKV